MNTRLKLERPIIALDIETTGLNVRTDRMIELAAVKLFPDGRVEEKCWLMNPQMPIPAETTAIHGITDEIVANCPTFAELAEEISDFFADSDIAGFAASRLDIPCLEEEFCRVGMNFGMAERKQVDAQRIFHKKEPRDLSAALRFYCGRDHAGAHGALADARATLDVLIAQLDRYADLPDTVDALEELLMPRDPRNADRNGLLRWNDRNQLCVNFGKNKGTPLLDLFANERSWLKWFVKGSFETDARMIVQDLLERGVLPPPPPKPDK